MRIGFLFILALIAVAGCSPEGDVGPRVVVTIHPLGAIVREVVGGDVAVRAIVPPRASPHTFDLKPSDARAAASALALVYVDAHLDGWATELNARRAIGAFALVPEELRLEWGNHGDHGGHGEFDPHFWGDPLAVKAMAVPLAEKLAGDDGNKRDQYIEKAWAFADELQGIHEKLAQVLEPYRGKSVIMFHPSWDYFMERYGIEVAGYLEPSPGQEPSPKDIQRLIELAKSERVQAVFTEPQLPRRPAELIAEAANLPLVEIDPIGGVDGRMTYEEILRYNARVMAEALE